MIKKIKTIKNIILALPLLSLFYSINAAYSSKLEQAVVDGLEAVEKLVKDDPNMLDYQEGETKITIAMYATYYNKVQIINFLASKKANMNIKAKNGDTALLMSLQDYQKKRAIKIETVKALIKAKADPNIEGGVNNTPIMTAILNVDNEKDLVEIISLLIDKGQAAVNLPNHPKYWPLKITLLRGYLDATEALLKRKANPDSVDENKDTPLLVAANSINTKLKGTENIINENDFEKITALLVDQYKADVNKADDDGFTPLMATAGGGHLQATKSLLRRNANPNLLTHDGDSTITYAVYNNDLPTLELLLKYKATLNPEDKKAIHPLMEALSNYNNREIKYETIEWLVNNGAKRNIVQNDMTTPFAALRNIKNEELLLKVIQLLLNENTSNHADIYFKAKQGFTFFMIASLRGYTNIIKYLVEEINLVPAPNEISLSIEYAIQYNHDNLLQYLLKKFKHLLTKEETSKINDMMKKDKKNNNTTQIKEKDNNQLDNTTTETEQNTQKPQLLNQTKNINIKETEKVNEPSNINTTSKTSQNIQEASKINDMMKKGKKNNKTQNIDKKKLPVILFITIILVFLTGGLFYFYNQSKKKFSKNKTT